MERYIMVMIITAVLAYPSGLFAGHGDHAAARKDHAAPVMLGDRGSTTRIDGNLSFTWDFDRTPSLGTVIVKIKVFDGNGNRVTSLGVTGESGMPGMVGAHDSGPVTFKLNRKGDYLMPVTLVMPGEWEVRIIFTKAGKKIFAGRIRFDV